VIDVIHEMKQKYTQTSCRGDHLVFFENAEPPTFFQHKPLPTHYSFRYSFFFSSFPLFSLFLYSSFIPLLFFFFPCLSLYSLCLPVLISCVYFLCLFLISSFLYFFFPSSFCYLFHFASFVSVTSILLAFLSIWSLIFLISFFIYLFFPISFLLFSLVLVLLL
jgi:hypothetical protein